MNYYQFHLGDYAAHTRHLSLLEDLAYRRMIDLYYTNESPLPLEVERIARLIGMRDHMQEVSDVLSDFFVKSEGGYRNSRCDKEIEAYQAKADRARSANKARWSPDKSNKRLKSDVKSDSNQIPTKNQEPRTNITTLSGRPDAPATKPKLKTNKPAAEEVLKHLNLKTGRSYRPVPANIDLIAARLSDGVSVDDCKAVINAKAAQWLDDAKMHEYLRPATLFNRTNFEQYLGQLGAPAEVGGIEDHFARAI